MPVEYLINSYKLLLLLMEKKTKAASAYLIRNNKGRMEQRRK